VTETPLVFHFLKELSIFHFGRINSYMYRFCETMFFIRFFCRDILIVSKESLIMGSINFCGRIFTLGKAIGQGH